MSYSLNELEGLKDFYSDQLLNDTIPFWFPRSYDKEYVGYLLIRYIYGY
jgi:N-acylglucosamine 2-epimerase